MKKINLKVWAGVMVIILLASACNDFLDINKNPNQATSSTPQLTLPSAIVTSATMSSQFNSYGAHFGGYMANAGGFSGFGNLLSYNLTPSDYDNLWTNTYREPLRDLKYVIDQVNGDSTLMYFSAAAKIMMAFNYQKLVDTFGDIPYSEALKGQEGNLTPDYDDAALIYADLIVLLDEAVTEITKVQEAGAASRIFPIRIGRASDPLFGPQPETTTERDLNAQLLDWKKFANTLKLKMLIRINAPAADFNDPDFTTYGFITDDAIVDPGYETNRPNPAWRTWGRAINGTLSNSSRIPTKFAYGFYADQLGNNQSSTTLPAKIVDPGRGQTIYVNFAAVPSATTTPTNQLGNETAPPPAVSAQVTWAGSGNFAGLGVLKGPAQGQPLMLLAEAKFLLAEALLFNKITPAAAGIADYTTAFNEGILASFTYLYKNQAEGVVTTIGTATTTMAQRVTTYQTQTANAANRLVNIGLATTDAQRLEAIITQKYIAVNMINSDEGYNEFRRTGYPVTIKNGAANRDIASNKSTITTSETQSTLPTRVMYPASEQSYNSAHYSTVDYRGVDKIFWDTNGVD